MNKVPTILWGFVNLNINFFNRLDIKFSICDNWSTTNSPGFFDFFNGAVPTKNDILTQDDHKGIFEVLEGNYRLL